MTFPGTFFFFVVYIVEILVLVNITSECSNQEHESTNLSIKKKLGTKF
jgi:hypothetical protein